jgi:hypothetical protein
MTSWYKVSSKFLTAVIANSTQRMREINPKIIRVQ